LKSTTTVKSEFKKRKKGKLELVSYSTVIVVLMDADRAVGLLTDSQTNAVAV
jgi:hypothetical protein